ncbi:MAG: hypothetical protein ACI8RD_014714 [Bacillariaceae sp.]|jgi:hypothetical protein
MNHPIFYQNDVHFFETSAIVTESMQSHNDPKNIIEIKEGLCIILHVLLWILPLRVKPTYFSNQT